MAISEKNFYDQIKAHKYQLFLIKTQLKPYKKEVSPAFKEAKVFIKSQSPTGNRSRKGSVVSKQSISAESPDKSDSVYSLNWKREK